jgi:hypothetical protein
MNCKCLTKVDEKLKEKGFKLSGKLLMFGVDHDTLSMSLTCGWPLERLDGKRLSRSDPKTMQMSHCPFCGKKATEKRPTKSSEC